MKTTREKRTFVFKYLKETSMARTDENMAGQARSTEQEIGRLHCVGAFILFFGKSLEGS